MKKRASLLSGILIILYGVNAFASGWVGISSSHPANAEVTLVSSDIHTTVLKITVHGYQEVSVNSVPGDQISIRLPGGSLILDAGAPDLSKLTASVIIPDLTAMKVEVLSSAYQDFAGKNVAPSRGSIYRTLDPSGIALQYGPAYSRNEFYPGTVAALRDPYILRDYRGQTVVIYPFQYNPVTKILRVYSELTVKIYEDSQAQFSRNPFVRHGVARHVNKEFQAVYTSHFKNPPTVQYTPLAEQGNMLIISDASFMPAMQPFVDWKNLRGIHTEMVDMATVGTTDADVMTYVANYYNTNGLTYLLLVGDYQQIPSPMQSPAQFGGASDPSYGYITGADSYAEVFVGRFSAQSVADVQTQVQRVLSYEMNPIPNAAFYSKGVCVASNQGPGDDNEYDWEHERNIRADLLGFSYTDVAELYDGDHQVGGVDAQGDPTSTDLFNVLQSGVTIMNYTGHGSVTSFGTTGFSSSDIVNMTNFNMLPFIWSVGCVNGDFTNGTCIAETFLRAQSGGQPTGAIATFMSSINQLWDEPMDAQDEMDDLLVGSSVHHTMRTFGGLSVNGCMHMNDEYGATGAEMTDTWHCFGDPSLEVRTAPPVTMTVSHAATVPLGTTQLAVNCNTDSAFVSLTIHGTIIGTGMVLNGITNITFASLVQTDTMHVTVTAFNAVPYMGTVIISGTTGIPQLNDEDQLVSVFPNPVKDKAVILLHATAPQQITVAIYDAQGRKVIQVADQFFSAGNHKLTCDTGILGAGNYFCRVAAGSKIVNREFTVIK